MGNNGLAGSTPAGKAAGSGAGGGQEIVSAAAGAGGEAKPRKIRNTKTKHKPGVLSLKEYPITEDTLDNIGTLRASAAFWMAVGSLCLGFVLSTFQSLSLAGEKVDAVSAATWWTYLKAGGFITIVSYLAAAFYFFKGKSVLRFVKENTVHDEE